MQIKLKAVAPTWSDSKYLLVIPSNLRVWTNSNRSGAVTGTTEFNATVTTTLYVEGYTTGSGKIKIKWKNDTKTLNECDVFKATVFKWIGPLNVPDYAIYQYKVDSPPTGSSQWITPVSGTIKTGSGTSDVTILWGSGPVVGKAVYQANGNYIWDLEVNVVQVKLKATPNSLAYGNPPVQNPGDPRGVIAYIPHPAAMDAFLMVEKIMGPTVVSQMRGVKFMQMGFIQNGRATRKHGNFDGFTPKKRWRSTHQDGIYHLDTYPGSTSPWYDKFRSSKTAPAGYYGFFAPSSDTTQNDVGFNVADTPNIQATYDMLLTIGGVTDVVDTFGIEIDFYMYFAVRTEDTKNQSNLIYTQRGSASWEFNGCGSINAATYVWTQTGTGNTGSGSFSAVTSGAVVPVTTGTPLNSLPEYWLVENQ